MEGPAKVNEAAPLPALDHALPRSRGTRRIAYDPLKGINLNHYRTAPNRPRTTLQRPAVLAAVIACLLVSSGATAEIRRIHTPKFDGTGGPDPFVCIDFKRQEQKKVECPDVITLLDAQYDSVTQPYQRAQFGTLESTFQRWRSGGKQLGDGTWELALFRPGLDNAFKTMTSDMASLEAWKKQKPNSVAARFVEANMYYVHALRVKGRDPHSVPSIEARAISTERLAKAAALLRKLKPNISDSPAWYETRIAVLVEQGSIAEARKVFDEAVKRFPQYHPLYLTMGAAYKGKALETFAKEAVDLTARFEGRGLYARLFRQIESSQELPVDLERSRFPAWPQLKAGYEDLLQRHPASIALATSFAAVACRTNESELYRELRSKASAYFIAAQFSVVPVDACDQRHGWKAQE